ncbi:KAR9-domain-containing protein [Didymella exigua CBS 183.55]|uniref:KAR9-domain-containing protein n=1 Tax=Didymella exigua CBS 183.55 TaxID=1150837 RepID=A0A6A5RVZ5_9PLEO|nr:KAR9-domain-containing protein [Didymella exigua CBS 183.55]KAF1931723.1 KAR9-domain-containing protein [Didymella exigua CBS 183.55]
MTHSSIRGSAADNDPMNSLPALQPADSPATSEVASTPPCPPAPANSTAATASSPPRTQLRRTASNSSSILDSTTKVARNVSPALLARMKFLNQATTDAASRNAPSANAIGRIAEEKIRQLDDFHSTKRTFSIERRGTAWSTGPGSQFGTPLIPQLTGESVPALVMERDLESDISSVISTSDRVLPSESEAEVDDVLDMQKYRLPDIAKTKSLAATVAESDTTPVADVERPPTPPPKDTPPQEQVSVLDSNHDMNVASYFARRHHLHRTNSIYTLSKASFTNQIQQLTSMKLPPTTIASEITALPSSILAGKALHSSANDIRLWMAKATEVLGGLDADDDVEWAAAAGREGLSDVDTAMSKFERLVNVYITAIEDLQSRPDIAALPQRDQITLVTQMEEIIGTWDGIKMTLKSVKNQVEIAMEWEELWNTVLGEIGAEVETLSRLVFEMEERRHRVISDSVAESAENYNIADLETIVEETPRQNTTLNNRLSMPPTLTVLSPRSPIPQIEQENSRLLEIFAKLQPLRASLDFLPMRLASFEMRASTMFPSACDELMRRKDQLEKQEKNLEAEADALREELGEDKWVHSFRQAGSKAVAMYDSTIKSIERLQQAIDDADDEKLGPRIAKYKDKRDHYPPSIKRVVELIDIGMKNRSTANGEILRIQQDVRQKMADLEQDIQGMDAILDEVSASRKLRDSVSTILSIRTEGSSAFDTPGSSPASSVVMSRKGSDHGTTPAGRKSRQSSTSMTKTSVPPNRRYSSLPVIPGSITTRKSLPSTYLEPTIARTMANTPTRTTRSSTPTERPVHKPRWNASTNMRDTIVGHYHKPASTPLRSVSGQSSIPVRSPLGRSSVLSPPPSAHSVAATPAKSSMRRPVASTIQAPSTPLKSPTFMHSSPSTSTPVSARRVTIADDDSNGVGEESPIARRTARPASAMNSRRTSLLPTPKSRTSSANHLSTPATTPARTTSRLANAEEGRKSRAGDGRVSGRQSSLGVSGRQSSAGDRRAWR